MSEQLLQLSDSDLRELAGVLRSGRLTAPFSTLALQRIFSSHVSPSLVDDLQHLADTGLTAEQMAAAVDLVVQGRRRRPQMDQSVTLVTSGPDAGSTTNRDTAVVVRDLFATPELTVLVAGYAVYQGNRVFQALADRMQDRPDLKVRLFLNIRRDGDTSSSNKLVRRFVDRFKRRQWPADLVSDNLEFMRIHRQENQSNSRTTRNPSWLCA